MPVGLDAMHILPVPATAVEDLFGKKIRRLPAPTSVEWLAFHL